MGYKKFSPKPSQTVYKEDYQLIDEAQTGFLKGRNITESYVYARHMLQHATRSNLPLALFKADITLGQILHRLPAKCSIEAIGAAGFSGFQPYG